MRQNTGVASDHLFALHQNFFIMIETEIVLSWTDTFVRDFDLRLVDVNVHLGKF